MSQQEKIAWLLREEVERRKIMGRADDGRAFHASPCHVPHRAALELNVVQIVIGRLSCLYVFLIKNALLMLSSCYFSVTSSYVKLLLVAFLQ